MTAPVLEFEMLVEMKVYMLEMIEEHKNEINSLVLIRQQYKKTGKISSEEMIKTRIERLTSFKNKEHNFISFLKDYLKGYKK